MTRRPKPRRSQGRRRKTRRRAARRPGLFALVFLFCVPALALYLVVQHANQSARNNRKQSYPLTKDEARAINDAVPFAEGPVKPARRYIFDGSPAARLQAADCLATAALYEAGGDERGQRAVMQVVLNRLRHRGYPKTVCGVVYQGSSRRTGCQFTFTCDGSLQRRTIRNGWAVARQRARLALDGHVFNDVGTATHYHTDWVVPYWSGSLEKIAQIRTHIFYRSRRV